MRRVLVIGVIVVLAVVWLAFMGYVNTRSSVVTVQVTGSVDQVAFYKVTDPTNPVAIIGTGGQDVQQSVLLRRSDGFSLVAQMPPARYYFVTKKNADIYTGRQICCTIGLQAENIDLKITALDQWSQVGQ